MGMRLICLFALMRSTTAFSIAPMHPSKFVAARSSLIAASASNAGTGISGSTSVLAPDAAGESSSLRPSPPTTPPSLSPETPFVLLLCCLIGAVCSLDRVLISIAILPMTEQYAYTDSTKGLIAAGFSLGYCLGLGPISAAASLGSPKQVLLGGLLVWSLAQAASPAAADVSVPALIGARALMGLGEAAAVPSLQSVAARFVPESSRSLFWGCLTASLSCGTLLAYTVSPPLIDEYGWPFAFELFGGAGFVIALLWAVLGADSPKIPLPGTAPTAEVQPPQLDGSTSQEGKAVLAAEGKGREAADASTPDPAAMTGVPWAEIRASRPVWALAAAHMSTNFFMYFGLSVCGAPSRFSALARAPHPHAWPSPLLLL